MSTKSTNIFEDILSRVKGQNSKDAKTAERLGEVQTGLEMLLEGVDIEEKELEVLTESTEEELDLWLTLADPITAKWIEDNKEKGPTAEIYEWVKQKTAESN